MHHLWHHAVGRPSGRPPTMMDRLIIIQARWESTRLPGKVGEKLGRLTMLQHVERRACHLGPYVVAWPRGGPQDRRDVLARYAHMVAGLPSVQSIVRLTADCPFLDVGVSQSVLDYYDTHPECSYVGTPPSWDGLDTEVFSREALSRAQWLAKTEEDREHVTPWMRRQPGAYIFPPTTPPLRWSVNTPMDLDWARRVVARCPRCAVGTPHHSNAPWSIGGAEGRWPRWDLHQMPEGDLVECWAYEVLMERVG